MRLVRSAALPAGVICCLLCACDVPEEPRSDVLQTMDPLLEDSGAASRHDLVVEFTGCTEFAGIGVVPAANARPLVPARYTLAGDATHARIVVRVARCAGAAVDGKPPRPTTISQIGISVVGPDSTADLNNYTLWYVTSQGALGGKLKAAGIDAEVEPGLTYDLARDLAGGGDLRIVSSPAQAPVYAAAGTVVVPTAPPTSFVASWWQDGRHRTTQMRTVFPALRFGGATMILTTCSGSALARLVGGTTLTFPLLDSFNTADDARMTVHTVAD